MDRFLRTRLRDPRFNAPSPSSEFAWYAPVQERLEAIEAQAPPSLSALAGNAPDAAGLAMAAALGAASAHPLHVVRDNAMKCWEGYERVPGTKPGADGSCRKKGSGGGSDKKKKKKKKREGGGASSSSSSSESDGGGGRRKKQKKAEE